MSTSPGPVLTRRRAVMHKMCSDERKCAVMKGNFLMMNYEELKYRYVRVEREV